MSNTEYAIPLRGKHVICNNRTKSRTKTSHKTDFGSRISIMAKVESGKSIFEGGGELLCRLSYKQCASVKLGHRMEAV